MPPPAVPAASAPAGGLSEAAEAAAWSLEVRLPATSANLGPGFDSAGLALDLWNRFTLAAGQPGHELSVEIAGEGATELPRDASNLVYQTFLDELAAEGVRPVERLRLGSDNAIPCASGLGSSSAAVLAGLVFARAYLARRRGEPYRFDTAEKSAILARGVEIEGHGDNLAPALFGGLVIVYTEGRRFLFRQVPMEPRQVVVCVPAYEYLTATARAALPTEVPLRDAVYNLGRSMLVIEALRTGDDGLLAHALNDRLHEPFRFPAIPGARAARDAALRAGAVAVTLSGAGPGLLAFARHHHAEIGRAMEGAFAAEGLAARSWQLTTTAQGARVGG
jgi:homoserine kinase